MKEIVKGLKTMHTVIESSRSLIQTIDNLERDDKQKEDHTQQLIQSLQQGNITQNTLNELVQEEQSEVKEEDKIVQLLNELVKEDKQEVQILENITQKIGQEEQQEDQYLSQLRQEITAMTQEGITQERLQTVMKHGKTAADILLDESHEEIQASQLSQTLAKELGFSASEIINAEKLEKEDEYEEKEIESLAQRINNEKLMKMTRSLEQHTKRDEQATEQDRKQLIAITEEAEQAEEQLESETKHTYEEAEELLKLLRQLRNLTQNSPMADQEFQQNFENLVGEAEEAEQEAQQAFQNEEQAEQTEAKAEQKAQNAV